MSLVKVSYSGAGTKVFSVKFSVFSLVVCNIMIALLKFLLEKFVIEYANYGGKLNPSLVLIFFKISTISLFVGAGTLTWRHLDLNG